MQILCSYFEKHGLEGLPCCSDCQINCGGKCRKYKHSSYKRYASLDSNDKILIKRFRCACSGQTWSILPEGMLPYRSVSVSDVEDDFEHRYGAGAEPEHSERKKASLQRAGKSFESRFKKLQHIFGTLLGYAWHIKEFWHQLQLYFPEGKGICYHQLGISSYERLDVAGSNCTSQMQQFLWHYAQSSLFGDYRCVKLGRMR